MGKRRLHRRDLLRGSAAGATFGPGAVAQTTGVLRLPVRHYQIAQLYGPGMPPSGEEGLHQETLEVPIGHAGLVLAHVWNLGEPDGPYPLEGSTGRPGEAGHWVSIARPIIETKIKPALEAAREAKLSVFHMAQASYARKYPQYRAIAKDPELNPPRTASYQRCVRPRSNEEIWKHEYGEGYPGPVWRTHPEKFDIAAAVKPRPDEDVFLTAHQLNGLCRRKDIDTLLYAGFMADICLLDVSGALREMANTYRYRCVALRDGTTAYEFAETHERGWMTFAAIRRVEQDMGFSALSTDFVKACEHVAKV